jgi:hypothetical protein
MQPDYAPENEMRRAEVVGCKVQFFYRNRTRIKRCWLSFWFMEFTSRHRARDKADRWVNYGIHPLSTRKPPRKKAETEVASPEQLFLPIGVQMQSQCVI